MKALFAVLERELRAYFVSPMAYAVMAFFLLVNGITFVFIAWHFNDPRFDTSGITPLDFFFGGFFFWIVIFLITSVMTMRLISEERRSGTIEALMTSPASEVQVVLGKYFAAFLFYAALWLPTLIYPLIIDRQTDLDWGPVASAYLGVLLIGGLFLSIGLFASSFAKNQIVSAIATFAMLLVLFIVSLADDLVGGETAKAILGHLGYLGHMEELAKGIVDSRRLAFYLSGIVLFLFLTSRSLAAKKWR